MLNRTMAEATPPAAGQKIARQKFSENNSNRPRHRPIVDARSRLADRRWRSREATTRSEVRSSGGGSRGGRLRSARLMASGFSRFSRSRLIPPPALLFANLFFGNQGSKSFPVSPAPPSAPAAPLFRAESWISPCPAKSPEFPQSPRNSIPRFPAAPARRGSSHSTPPAPPRSAPGSLGPASAPAANVPGRSASPGTHAPGPSRFPDPLPAYDDDQTSVDGYGPRSPRSGKSRS